MASEPMVLSERLNFEQLANTRDLGGMTGADGFRIKKGKLFRSGLLSRASEADLEKLGPMLSTVVDFRSNAERHQQPDPVLEGVEYVALPAVEDKAPGVTRDEESIDEILLLMKDAEAAIRLIVPKHYDQLFELNDRMKVAR